MDVLQVVGVRYASAFLLTLLVSNPIVRPGLLQTAKPMLQVGRSALLLGSTFFNFRLNETQNPVLSEPFAIGSKYSMLEMLRDNNPTGRFPRRNVSMPVVEWTNSLTSHCGSDPEISW